MRIARHYAREASLFHIANASFWEAALIPVAVVVVIAFSSCMDFWIGQFISLSWWYAANFYSMTYALQVLHPQLPAAFCSPFAPGGVGAFLLWCAAVALIEMVVYHIIGSPSVAHALGTTIYGAYGCMCFGGALPASWRPHKVARYVAKARLLELPPWLSTTGSGSAVAPNKIGAAADHGQTGATEVFAAVELPPTPVQRRSRAPGPFKFESGTYAGQVALGVSGCALYVAWSSIWPLRVRPVPRPIAVYESSARPAAPAPGLPTLPSMQLAPAMPRPPAARPPPQREEAVPAKPAAPSRPPQERPPAPLVLPPKVLPAWARNASAHAPRAKRWKPPPPPPPSRLRPGKLEGAAEKAAHAASAAIASLLNSSASPSTSAAAPRPRSLPRPALSHAELLQDALNATGRTLAPGAARSPAWQNSSGSNVTEGASNLSVLAAPARAVAESGASAPIASLPAPDALQEGNNVTALEAIPPWAAAVPPPSEATAAAAPTGTEPRSAALAGAVPAEASAELGTGPPQLRRLQEPGGRLLLRRLQESQPRVREPQPRARQSSWRPGETRQPRPQTDGALAAAAVARAWGVVLLVGALASAVLVAVDWSKDFEFSVPYLVCYNLICLRVPDLLGQAVISGLGDASLYSSPAWAITATSCAYMVCMQGYLLLLRVVCKNMSSQFLFPRFQFVAQLYYYLFWYMMLMIVSPHGVEDSGFWVMVAMLNGNYLVSNLGFVQQACSCLTHGSRSPPPDPPLKVLFDSKLAVQDQLADVVSLLVVPAIATSFHVCTSLSVAQYPQGILISLWQRFGVLLAARVLTGLLTEEIFRRRLDILAKADTMELQLLPLGDRANQNRPRYLNDICVGPKLALEPLRNIERCELYFAAVAVTCTFAVFQRGDLPSRYAFVAFGS